jgi:hypothetical protein
MNASFIRKEEIIETISLWRFDVNIEKAVLLSHLFDDSPTSFFGKYPVYWHRTAFVVE